MAAIKLDLQSCKSARDDPVMHLLPCEIEFDGEAKVDQFFGTGIREDQTSGKGNEFMPVGSAARRHQCHGL